jgi:GNAT superfamily N-acetyltransferase
MFRAVVGTALTYHHVIEIGDPLLGGAVWHAPGQDDGTDDEWHELGMGEFVTRIGRDRALELQAFMTHLDDLAKSHRPQPSWYLAAIGVEPGAQGRGLGRKLLEWGVERAERAGERVYIETNAELNVPFYERAGLRVVHFEEYGDSKLPLWCMTNGVAPGDE